MPEADRTRAPRPRRGPRRVHIVGIGGAGHERDRDRARRAWATGERLRPQERRPRSSGCGRSASTCTSATGAENVPADADAVVVSTAIPRTNPEVVRGRRARDPGAAPGRGARRDRRRTRARRSRSPASHGKTTTSSMLALILRAAGLAPSFLIGGELNEVGTNAACDDGEWLVVEADESDGTFLELGPEAAIVTNVEPDHLDHYGDFDALGARVRAVRRRGRRARSCAAPTTRSPRALAAAAPRRRHLRLRRRRRLPRSSTTQASARRLPLHARRRRRARSARSRCRCPAGTTRRTRPAPRRWRSSSASPFERGRERARRLRRRRPPVPVPRRARRRHVRRRLRPPARRGRGRRSARRARAAGAASSPCSSRTATRRTASLWRDFADAFAGADAVVLTDVYPAGETPIARRLRPAVLHAVLDAHPDAAGRVPPAPRRPRRHVPRRRPARRPRADPRRRRPHDAARRAGWRGRPARA